MVERGGGGGGGTEGLLKVIMVRAALDGRSGRGADSRSGLIRLRVAGVSSGLSCKHT